MIPDKPPFHLESWPWPLKIFTLGRFQILKEDDPLKFSRKAQHRPLSMLKALIALGGKEVREDQISDALWPEAEAAMWPMQSFATNLHRLRKLLGNEKAVQLREGRLSLDERFCWVDVWAFERVLGQADVRWKEKSKANAVCLVEKAMDLYKRALPVPGNRAVLGCSHERTPEKQIPAQCGQAGSIPAEDGTMGEGSGLLPEGAGSGPSRRRILPGSYDLPPAPRPPGRGPVGLPTAARGLFPMPLE